MKTILIFLLLSTSICLTPQTYKDGKVTQKIYGKNIN